MKILVVVSEFPKITETFAYRNLVEYDRLGHEPWLFHVRPFRRGVEVHEFFRPLLPRVFGFGWLDATSLGGFLAEWARAPGSMFRLMALLLRSHWREPMRGLVVLAIAPKSVALGRWCRRTGIDHVHGEFAGHPATATMIAARVAGLPYSFTCHANDIFVSQAMLAEKAVGARFVRAISRFNIRFLSQLPGFPAEKLRLIRCGVPVEVMADDLPEAPGPEGLRILYVGSLIRKKGVTHLLDALARLPGGLPWHARVLGGGDLAKELAQQAEALGLSDRVTFEGPQTAEVVAAAHRWAHVLVVPSIVGMGGRVEGIPVVLMEAMGRGRVVVASDLSGISELVEHGKTGWLVPAGDNAAIAAALRDIAADWPAAARIGEAGRDRICADYTISENASSLAEAMQEPAP